MMNRRALLFALLLPVVCALQSQSYSCGNELFSLSPADRQAPPDWAERALRPMPKGGRRDTVAVTIHVVETNNADSKLSPQAIAREMAVVNDAFQDAGIYFQPCGPIRTIKGEPSYSFTTGGQLNRAHHVPNTVNLYFADWIQSELGFPICGFSAFPWMERPIDRYIMMSKPCLDEGITLTHEFGHFYGLYHTHETHFGAEYVDGSNCSSAGDKICDTPADPNLARAYITSNCSYQGGEKDSRGASYRPPVTNFMSYAPSQCRRQFSPMQNALMRSVQEKENAYLYRNCDFYPDFTIAFNIGSSITVRSGDPIPVSYAFSTYGVTQDYDLDLNFYIADQPGATGTPIRSERLFIQNGEAALKRNYKIDFPGTRGSGRYFLVAKIDAYNKIVERAEENNTITLTVNVDNSSFADVLLFPNPVGDELRFFLRDEEREGLIQVRIFHPDGRLVRELPDVHKEDAEVLGRIPVADLPTGFYLLSVVFRKDRTPRTFRFWKE